jgi:hypothetical protein
MNLLRSIFALTLVALYASCADSTRPNERRVTASAALTEDIAAQPLVDSGYLKTIASRLGEPAGLRYSLESKEPDGYVFWVYEDRGTHAATIDRAKVAPDGKVFVLDVVTDEWKEFRRPAADNQATGTDRPGGTVPVIQEMVEPRPAVQC